MGQPTSASGLAGWITSKITVWEDARNRGYQRLWGEYWRMWRGQWNEQDKNRLSERSRLVAPALAQAIEMTVSEIEEAIFSHEEWFDIETTASNTADQLTQLLMRDQLLDDLDVVNAADQIMEAVMNGAIFGTMIAKVNVFVGEEPKPTRDAKTFKLKTNNNKRVYVSIESIRPDEFIPDPVAKTIQQMMGCAHRVQRTMHYVTEKIAEGTYRSDALHSLAPTRRLKNSDSDQEDPQSINTTYESEQVDILEYHGKVPADLLFDLIGTDNALDNLLKADLREQRAKGQGKMVEAIVTVCNTGVILRAMVNPFTMKDRSIVAAQFEKVPSRFWGRGVAEKGYNPQKALDSELRARMDALGFISAPMLGVDSGRIPRSFKMEVKPGKVWTTQGPPNEVLQPVQIAPNGGYNTLTFEQTQEMERMVQMGTGAFDTASALKAQSQSGANGASANSALMGAFVKRSKRSIANISRNFIKPLLDKVMWRYMQFDPIRYPTNFDLKIKTTMGIVAREVEASQMTQLMGMMPPDFHQAQLMLAKGIVNHTSLSNKGEIMQVIDSIINPSKAQQQMQQKTQQQEMAAREAQLQSISLDNEKKKAEIEEITARAHMHTHEATVNTARIQQDYMRIKQTEQENHNFAEQNQIARERMVPEMIKAQAALISAKKKPAGGAKAA
jgi:hypothetical protein